MHQKCYHTLPTENSKWMHLDPDEEQHLTSIRMSEISEKVQEEDTKPIKGEEDIEPQQPLPSSQKVGDVDEDTAKAIAAAQNEYSTRRARRSSIKGGSEMARSPTAASPPPTTTAPTKKRPAPKNSSKGGVKTSTSKKPPTKKRKVQDNDARATPASHDRSATPASLADRTSKTPGAVKKPSKTTKSKSNSATPLASSSPAPLERPHSRNGAEAFSDVASSVEDENEVYCICRKPDNHTWMIGCDGGCEDWFHGKCVNIAQQDEGLIDKYICPNCTEREQGSRVTTWKPMCRRNGCRKPARLKKGKESKYCTDECGARFMREQLERSGALDYREKNKPQRGKRSETTDIGADIGPLGGSIRAHELKTLLASVPDAASFRRLGSTGVLTPPETASPDAIDVTKRFDDTSSNASAGQASYTPQEQARLTEIGARKTQLRDRRKLLKDRESFVVWAKERAGRAKEEKREGCQYDSRLAWDEVTFRGWKDSDEGLIIFEKGRLDADSIREDAPKGSDVDVDGAEAAENKGWICGRKKCGRHSGWQKIALQDVRFEEAEVGDEMRAVDAEETEMTNAATVRRKRGAGEGSAAAREGGAVEVVDAIMAEG